MVAQSTISPFLQPHLLDTRSCCSMSGSVSTRLLVTPRTIVLYALCLPLFAHKGTRSRARLRQASKLAEGFYVDL